MSFDSSATAEPIASSVRSLLEAGSYHAKYSSIRPRDVRIPLEGTRNSIQWIISRVRVFDRERVHASMEYTNKLLGRGALASVDAAADECRIVYDGFGGPRLDLGTLSFPIAAHHAHVLTEHYGITECMDD